MGKTSYSKTIMNKQADGNLNKVTKLIEAITKEPAKILAVPGELVHFVGSAQKAVFLSQLLYWSDKGTRSDGYIFKTKKDWKNEIGLSEYQITRYTAELIESEFLDTKLKKAFGNPTVHYKLDVEKLLVAFREFLTKRFTEKNGKEHRVSEDSLTDSTSNNTQDIFQEREAPSSKIEVFHGEDLSNLSSDVSQETNQSYVEKTSNDRHAEDLVPLDFEPSLDAKFRAVLAFPEKHQRFATAKFIQHFRAKKLKKTPPQWKNEWWNWMSKEYPSRGNDLIESEHDAITRAVCSIVVSIYNGLPKYVVLRDEIAAQGAEYELSEESVHGAFTHVLARYMYFDEVEDYYFDIEKYWEDEQWRNAIDLELDDLGLPRPQLRS